MFFGIRKGILLGALPRNPQRGTAPSILPVIKTGMKGICSVLEARSSAPHRSLVSGENPAILCRVAVERHGIGQTHIDRQAHSST